MRRNPDTDTDAGYDRPSKTRVKQAMLELQDLGLALLELPVDQLDAIEMDDRLREALEELRRITAHSARKRQMQYVGKLLRSEDQEPFRQAIAGYRAGRRSDAKALHDVERWRERLLLDTAALGQWFAEHPQTDTPKFRKLVELAASEARDAAEALRQGQPRGKSRYYRELFRQLREAMRSPTTE